MSEEITIYTSHWYSVNRHPASKSIPESNAEFEVTESLYLLLLESNAEFVSLRGNIFAGQDKEIKRVEVIEAIDSSDSFPQFFRVAFASPIRLQRIER